MSRDICHAKQPEKTTDLIESLQDEKTGEDERHALQALKSEMVLCFKDTPKSRYWKEAMLISATATGDEYEGLVYGFAKAIKESTALAPQVVRYFAGCIRWGSQDIPSAEQWFGLLLEALTGHLVAKNDSTDLRMIYLLTDAIGTLLDAMVERKFEGIDRLKVHEPLMKKLASLKKHDEPRMAQAAQYAFQSLQLVPDDESPWEEALRWTGVGIKAVAKVSSGVTKLDILQVIDAGPSVLEIVAGLGEALKAAIDTWTACDSLKELVQVVRNKAERKDWYYLLTRSKIFIQLGSYPDLQKAIQGLRCCEKSEFWCGLYAQLERQWHHDESSRDNIESFIEWTFKDSSWKTAHDKDNAIQTWIGLLADSFQKPQLKSRLPKRTLNPLRKLRKSKLLSRQNDTSEAQLKPSFLESRMDTTEDQNLLNDALERSKAALVFYADAILAQHYIHGNLLHIKRLSGEDLPMENCYINLSLMEYIAGSDEKQRDDRLSLFQRLEAEAPKAEKEVSLEDVFKVRDLHSGTLGRPGRVLIRGRAGVGKTTMCKKITHAFLHDKLWKRHYDRLIWIPLRNLKRNRGYNSYVALIEVKFFGKVSGKTRLWEAFKSKLDDPRTLFLLDGLDEIAGDAENINTFQGLLNRQNVILTTRPHAAVCAGISQYDLEIETVGFLDKQVESYVDRVCEVPVRSQIKDFICQHWMLRGLMRIPIQLDAFCFTWEEGIDLALPLTTMTALYHAIEVKLWKKDIPRISPTKILDAQGDPSDCQHRRELQEIAPKAFEFLENIAFLGMYNNVTEFTRRTRDQFRLHFFDVTMSDRVLKETSFLRSSESSSHHTHDYYFLHLTFQEYFAAHHFVQCWKSSTEIKTLDLKSGKVVSFHAEELIQREKYNGRFNIMWRFVSGILGMGYSSPEEDIVKLFQQIEMRPRDLLGKVHAQLLMCCLNEITEDMQSTTLIDIRKNVDNQLLQLLLTEAGCGIARNPELPERVIMACLEKGRVRQQSTILECIPKRPQISLDLSNYIRKLKNSSDRNTIPGSSATISHIVAESVGKFSTFSSEEVIEIINSSNDYVALRGITGLTSRSNISDEAFKEVADTLFSSRGQMIADIVQRLQFPPCIVQDMISQISARTFHRQWAVRVLATQSLPNMDIADQLLEWIDDPVERVRKEVYTALKNHINLSKSSCIQIFQRMKTNASKSSFSDARLAIWALGNQQTLPPEVVDPMWDFLESKDEVLRECSYKILHQHTPFQEDVILKRFTESRCQSLFALAITGGAYIKDIPPPRDILDHWISLVKQFGSKNMQCRDPEDYSTEGFVTVRLVIRALSYSRFLPTDILETLWEFVDCAMIGAHIEVVLSNQEYLPNTTMDKILHRALDSIDKSEDDASKRFGLTMLRYLFLTKPLPDAMIELLAGLTLAKNTDAITFLCDLPKIPLHFLKPLAVLFLSQDTISSADELARKNPDFRAFVCSLGREHWISQLRLLLYSSKWNMSYCCSQNGQLQVVDADESWSASIEQPGQSQHIGDALDAIEEDIQIQCGGAWKALGLWSLNRRSFL